MKIIFFLLGVSLLLSTDQLYAQNQEKVDYTKKIDVEQIDEQVYRYVTYFEFQKWGAVGANGLLIKTSEGVVVVDAPWTNEQSVALVNWVKEKWQEEIKVVIACHSHIDCVGGLEALHAAGAESYSLTMTQEFLSESDFATPVHGFSDSLWLNYGGVEMELFYPGAAHAKDNIVVWLTKSQILFGGCAVKTTANKGLGNTADADIGAWPNTINSLIERYPNARYIVPGHGDIGGIEYLDHTLKILSAND